MFASALLNCCWRGGASYRLTSRALISLILREAERLAGVGPCLASARHPASKQQWHRGQQLLACTACTAGRAMHAVLMSASVVPASASPLTDHKPSGQPEPSAWKASLAANQMQLNLHMASCWFARVSLTTVCCLECSDFRRMQREVRVANASACE